MTMTNEEEEEELEERRQAEVEFVSSAYSPEEAWCTTTRPDKKGKHKLILTQVHRRLQLSNSDNNDNATNISIGVVLTLTMTRGYPASSPLEISFALDDSNNSQLTKAAFNGMPQLVAACTQVAQELVGEEAVFAVLSQADEWMAEHWPQFCTGMGGSSAATQTTAQGNAIAPQNILGRRLIYSHHIISKVKRGNLKELASHYQLTGYVKIGWPGLIIIEGPEQHCQYFYDDIKQWAWKYLVVRGEQQEKAIGSLDSLRKFDAFLEVSDMSLVADHCRQVGLESLFRTSMKVYDNNDNGTNANETGMEHDTEPYGTLVWVDHMNSGKAYRKWLRKTAQDTGALLLIKQCYPNHDFTKRPTILVAIIGEQAATVQDFMKRWRTSRVDVDSKGKPCLERKMTILHEGNMEDASSIGSVDWDTAAAEDQVNTSHEQLVKLIQQFGNAEWNQACQSLLVSSSSSTTKE